MLYCDEHTECIETHVHLVVVVVVVVRDSCCIVMSTPSALRHMFTSLLLLLLLQFLQRRCWYVFSDSTSHCSALVLAYSVVRVICQVNGERPSEGL